MSLTATAQPHQAELQEEVTLTFRPLKHERLANLLKPARRRFGFAVVKRGSEMPISKTPGGGA
jgi:hypothetical protein